MKPGETIPAAGEIKLNDTRDAITLNVANSGDRPIQVGSHYHFFEALFPMVARPSLAFVPC